MAIAVAVGPQRKRRQQAGRAGKRRQRRRTDRARLDPVAYASEQERPFLRTSERLVSMRLVMKEERYMPQRHVLSLRRREHELGRVDLGELLRRREIRHQIRRPCRPQTNGKVERFHQTMARQWAYGLGYRSSPPRSCLDREPGLRGGVDGSRQPAEPCSVAGVAARADRRSAEHGRSRRADDKASTIRSG